MAVNVEFGACPFERIITLKKTHDAPFEDTSQVKPQREEIVSGRLYFGQHGSEVKHMPFILAEQDTSVEDILSMLVDEWRVPLPKILLFVIAPSKELSDNNRKIQKLLVKGLITALNTTEMWLCTNGVYSGFSKDLSLALANELSRRQILVESMHKMSVSTFPETAVIGINPLDSLNFADKLEPTTSTSNTGAFDTTEKSTISKYFNYFIFVKDHNKRLKGVQNLLLRFANCLREKLRFERKGGMDSNLCSIRTYETPIITLLFQGEASDIHLVLGLIKSRLPVVIVEGSGGLADILAFAYHHITCRPDSSNIAEFTEIVLKPLLCQKINQYYPNMSNFNLSERNFCEKIFDCFRHFKQQEQIFLTILTLRDLEDKSMPLTSHLLRSLFKSVETEKIKDSFQIKNDLFLAMDWNSPNVASTNIFEKDPTSKFHIDNETFFRALTKPQREQFVSIFLDRGFVLHRFLDSKTLLQLFQDSLSREFFRSVIWESYLGFGSTTELTRQFIETKLVLLLENLTGIPSLIKTFELNWYSRRIYDNCTPEQAERKAVAVLTLWGILSYRVNLVKNLWKFSEQPIHLALVSSTILRNLSPYVSDLSLKNEMEKQSEEFSVIATNVITKCYDTLPPRALDLLREKNPVWCYKPLIEIAAFAKDRRFIANSCCQKYLDNLFMGNIKVRDLPYGDVAIPIWMKIILSNFLIFPMYLWIDFGDESNGHQLKHLPLKNQSNSSVNKVSMSSKSVSSNNLKSKQLSFRQKLSDLYTAPISKFWISQVFYLIFLYFFSLAVIWPACGSLYLDFITCLWTLVIIMDSIYQVVILGKNYSSMSLVYKSTEIVFMSIFLFCYVLSRIVWYPTIMSPYSTKVVLCISLLYFYYRVIFIAYPISPELGPMLRRIKRMALVDFSGFMRVTILIVISNGIVIHATIYPDYPLNTELARRTFFDAMIAFFLTPADHFGEPDPTCILLPRNPNRTGFLGIPENVCKVGRYYLPECPNPGFWPYIFGLQYFLLLKLVLLTILLALFSNTEMKMGALGTYIWKYQRYELVVTFANRLAFPPPFSPISYCIMLFKYVRNFFLTKDKRFEEDKELLLDENDYVYWKGLASEYDMKINEEDQKDKTKDHMAQICSLIDALRNQKESMADLESMLLKLQIQVKNAHKYLTSSMMQVSLKERLLAKNVPQIFSRISPYPFTNISRFPVSNNHVTWDRSWKSYDPIAYNMPKEDFPPDLRSFVDIDIQMLREIDGEDFRMPIFKWNKTSLSPAGMSLDRKSWVVGKSGKSFEYELDAEGLPLNPFGRTGLRGRGALPRWGPNHHTFVIITKWHEMEMATHRNYLDVVLYLPNSDVLLPGGYVSTENTYFTIQSLFHSDSPWNSEVDMINFFELLSKEDVEAPIPVPEVPGPSNSRGSLTILDNLRKSSLAKVRKLLSREQNSVSRERDLPSREHDTESDEMMSQEPFISDCIKRGYLDEATNTDQAWCEAEVWHFHYNGSNTVEEKFKSTMLWLILTDDVLERVPPGQAACLYSVVKKMKAVLEVT